MCAIKISWDVIEPQEEETRVKLRPDGIPRRSDVLLDTPIERKIREARAAVEAGSAHPLMTEASVLLGQAKDKVSDCVELDLNNFVTEQQGGVVMDPVIAKPVIHTFSKMLGSKNHWIKVQNLGVTAQVCPSLGDGRWVAGRLTIFSDPSENFWQFFGDNNCYPQSLIVVEDIKNCDSPDATPPSPAECFQQVKRCSKCHRLPSHASKYCGDGKDKDNEHQWERMTEEEQIKHREGRIKLIKTAARAEAFEDVVKVLAEKAAFEFLGRSDGAVVWLDASDLIGERAQDTRILQRSMEQEFGRYDG